MKFLLILAVLGLGAAPVLGQWKVEERKQLPAVTGAEFARIEVSAPGRTAELHVVSARSAAHTVAVVDDPGAELQISSAAESCRALAAVNGGYFDPAHEPLGLVIVQGKVVHPLQRAKLLSGLVLSQGARVLLQRTAEYKASPATRAALQAGPFLVDGGKAVPGLNATRSAARTVVFTAESGIFGLLTCRHATLAETAEILVTRGLLPGHPIQRALNLDGGSSTGLWVRREAGPYYQREFKRVRTYLAIVPR